MSEWFEDESFWQALYQYLFPAAKFIASKEEIEKLLTLLDFKGSTVLDLCCGPGRHSMELARHGFRVTGVDRSGYLLGKAKKMAKLERLDIEWVREDMRKFSRPGSFDLALNFYTSLGFFEDEKENLDVLTLMFQNLNENGIAVLEMAGKEILARVYQPTISTELPDGSLVVQRVKMADGWDRCLNDWYLISGGKVETYSFSHTLYSGKELKLLLLEAGFKKVKLFGNLDGDEYGPGASRLIAAAYKN
jgi:SAM-dependent methyltransferase